MTTRDQILDFVTEELSTASAVKTAEELARALDTKLFADLRFTSEHAMIVAGAIEEQYDLDFVDAGDIMGCKDVADVVDLVCGYLGIEGPSDPAAPTGNQQTAWIGTPSTDEALGKSDEMDAADIAAFFPEFGN